MTAGSHEGRGKTDVVKRWRRKSQMLSDEGDGKDRCCQMKETEKTDVVKRRTRKSQMLSDDGDGLTICTPRQRALLMKREGDE